MARVREQRWAYARSWLDAIGHPFHIVRENSICPPPLSPSTDWERVQRENIRTYFFLSSWAGGILQILQSDWFRERAVFSPSGPLTAGGSFRHHLLGFRKKCYSLAKVGPQAVSNTSGTVFPNTDLPSGEEHIDIFSRPTKAIVYIIHVYEQLTVCSVGCFLLSVLWYDLKNRKRVSFPCYSHKTLSHLELNFKRRLIVLDVRFKNWGISLRWCSRISPSFSWGLLDHVLRLYQYIVYIAKIFDGS